MVSLLALTGVFQPPKFEGGYTAVPMLSDPASSSLFVFIMFPGAYNDVYEIASKVKFANIFIVPVSLNVDYVSDVHRLVTDLTPLKKNVKVLFPGRYQLPVNNLNENCIIRGGTDKCSFTFPEGFIAFDYVPGCECGCCNRQTLFPFSNQCDSCRITSDDKSAFHDIYVYYKDKGYLFTSTAVNKHRIKALLKDNRVEYVYVPYSYGYTGQENFLTLAGDPGMRNYINHVIAYGYRNYEEFLECYKHYRFSTPMTYRHLFAEDGVTSFNPNRSPVIGNIAFCPSILFRDINTDLPTYESGKEVKDEEIYRLPLPEELEGELPKIHDKGLHYITKKLEPGANDIKRVIATTDVNPFVIWFTAVQRITQYNIDDEGKMNVVNIMDNINASWDDISVGYYTPEMKHVPINISNNMITTSGESVRISFFDEHVMTPGEDGENLIVGVDTEVYVTYVDILEEIVVDSEGEYPDIASALEAASACTTIRLSRGVYDTPITINKTVHIIGDPGAMITAPVTLEIPEENFVEHNALMRLENIISIHNVSFGGDGIININTHDAGETLIVLKDCDMTLDISSELAAKYNNRVMPIRATGYGLLGLVVNQCRFGNNGKYSYNLFEIDAKLCSETIWLRNKFEDGCCTHNIISVYGISDNATFLIDSNHAFYSANMVRLGFKGKPAGTVLLQGNSYDTTDNDDAYAGLILVQPYSNKTESFAGVTIKINKTSHPDKLQLGYLHAGTNDMQWTNNNKPTVYIDGEKICLKNTLSIKLPASDEIESGVIEDVDGNIDVI